MVIAIDANREDNAALTFMSSGNYPRGTLMAEEWRPITETGPPYEPLDEYSLLEVDPGDVIFLIVTFRMALRRTHQIVPGATYFSPSIVRAPVISGRDITPTNGPATHPTRPAIIAAGRLSGCRSSSRASHHGWKTPSG